MSLSQLITEKITIALSGAEVTITDYTAQHIDHGAPGAHVKVEVTWKGFQDMALIDQHKQIYKILDEELKNQTIHALQIKTKSE